MKPMLAMMENHTTDGNKPFLYGNTIDPSEVKDLKNKQNTILCYT